MTAGHALARWSLVLVDDPEKDRRRIPLPFDASSDGTVRLTAVDLWSAEGDGAGKDAWHLMWSLRGSAVQLQWSSMADDDDVENHPRLVVNDKPLLPSTDGTTEAASCLLQNGDVLTLRQSFADEADTPMKRWRVHWDFRVYALAGVGPDMLTVHQAPLPIRLSLRQLLVGRGATMVDSLADGATHVVVSDVAPLETIARALLSLVPSVQQPKKATVEALRKWCQYHRVVLARRSWVTAAPLNRPLREPTWKELRLETSTAPTEVDRYATPSRRKRRRSSVDPTSPRPHNSLNQRLSNLLAKLAKTIQDAPLLEADEWRAYTWQLLSSRLVHMEQIITRHNYRFLRDLPGVGQSTFDVMEEFIRTGGVSTRLQTLQADPRRRAMNDLMHIWGVGKLQASRLLQGGYESIAQVRRAVADGQVDLPRAALLGLECYEDLRLKMTRSEVEEIFQHVQVVIQQHVPADSEIYLMGSYRRGAEALGDIDILVTHRDWKRVPPLLLGSIADHLKEEGLMEHHLTVLRGMEEHKHLRTSPSKVDATMQHASSTYFGIIPSPVPPHHRRRIDIKLYPYPERYFAMLYFTGNGHFNRSMRLWCKRKFQWSLNDHGLFDAVSGKAVLVNPRSEQDVFDKVQLVYKEPHERLGFDAVVPLLDAADDVDRVMTLSRSELRQDEDNFQWID